MRTQSLLSPLGFRYFFPPAYGFVIDDFEQDWTRSLSGRCLSVSWRPQCASSPRLLFLLTWVNSGKLEWGNPFSTTEIIRGTQVPEIGHLHANGTSVLCTTLLLRKSLGSCCYGMPPVVNATKNRQYGDVDLLEPLAFETILGCVNRAQRSLRDPRAISVTIKLSSDVSTHCFKSHLNQNATTDELAVLKPMPCEIVLCPQTCREKLLVSIGTRLLRGIHNRSSSIHQLHHSHFAHGLPLEMILEITGHLSGVDLQNFALTNLACNELVTPQLWRNFTIPPLSS